MAQRRPLAWTELRVGFLVIASFTLLVIAIFFIGGESGFLTEKYTLIAYFPAANGLKAGAEVHLEGVVIGNVGCATWMAWRCNPVRISSDPDPARSVEVEMRLDRRYQNIIRDDSKISMDTVGLLGDKTIEISRGSEDGQPLPDGGVLNGEDVPEMKEVIRSANSVLSTLNDLSEQFKQITERIQKGEGTLGKILTDQAIYDHMDETIRNTNKTVENVNARITTIMTSVDSLVADAHKGNGTIGRLISDPALYNNVNDSVTRLTRRVDDLIARVESGEGSAAKLLNDPALYNNANKLMENANKMVDTTNTAIANANQLIGQARDMFARIDRGEGTIGKFFREEAFYTDLKAMITRFSDLVNNIENGEGTTGKLINDPAVFNNIKDLTAELQKFVYDLRQDPKRYMNVTFRLF